MSIVFAAPLGSPGAEAGSRQPAFRAWADALLVRLASLSSPALSESVATRRTGRIARLKPEAPFIERLIVEPSLCSVAVPSAELQLFAPSGWSDGLVEYLTDNGINRDLIEEHLPVCAAPLWPTRTNALPDVLKDTRSDLLLLVGRYFAEDVRRYLGSWHPMDSALLEPGDQMEVVVTEAESEAAGL